VHSRQTDRHTRHISVLETSLADAGNLLTDDHVVEVIVLLALHRAVKNVAAVQMFARSQTAGEQVALGHLVDQLLTDVFTRHLLLLRLRHDVLLAELAAGALEAAVGVIVVGRLKLGVQP
jgi:predicted nucleic acid-binding protein